MGAGPSGSRTVKRVGNADAPATAAAVGRKAGESRPAIGHWGISAIWGRRDFEGCWSFLQRLIVGRNGWEAVDFTVLGRLVTLSCG